MTPKEKGDELISKYLDLQIHGLSTIAASNRAIQCSIIAVEEIIKQAEITDNVYKSTVWATIDRDEGEPNKHLSVPYWSKVLNYLKSKQ